MCSLNRPSCAFAIGTWAFASCALAMQSCAVFVSSDCAQRADCVEDAGRMDVAIRPLDGSIANSETGAAREAAGTPPDASADAGAHDAPDGGVDSSTQYAAQDAGDAGPDATNDAGIDAVVEAAADAGTDAGIDSAVGPPGPSCPVSSGGLDTCNTGEHCCLAAPTRATTCAATCNTGSYPVDCPGASGPGGCGTQSCCGTLVFDGGATTTNCYVPKLTAGCTDTCNDNFPAAVASCRGAYTVRLCTAGADCAGDLAGNTYCCNFGSPPGSFNWCVAGTIAAVANSCVQ